MKRLTKIMFVLVIVAITLLSVSPFVMATGKNPSGYTGGTASTSGIENLGNQIITIIATIGSIISVIVLIVLGVKYMMGSPEEKAEYKKTLLPYVIGAVLVFAASAIAAAIFAFASPISI